eukprot:5357875-Prymnesium_polylepis.1
MLSITAVGWCHPVMRQPPYRRGDIKNAYVTTLPLRGALAEHTCPGLLRAVLSSVRACVTHLTGY